MPITALTGWVGLAYLGALNNYYRFTSDGVNIPLGIEVPEDVHLGQRVPGLYRYTVVQPEGDLGIPLIAYGYTPQTGLDPTMQSLLRLAILPTAALPDDLPELGEVHIYRGDVDKMIEGAVVNRIEISAQANSRVDLSVGIRGIWGEKNAMLATALPVPGSTTANFNDKVRAIHFNELEWGTLPGLTMWSGISGSSSIPVPRNCRLSIDNNMIPDDSWNPTNPRAIRGFALGNQRIEGSITVVGFGAVSGEPTVITPWNESYDFGGIYLLDNGIWSASTVNVPGPSEISVTELTLTGMSATKFGIAPGSLL